MKNIFMKIFNMAASLFSRKKKLDMENLTLFDQGIDEDLDFQFRFVRIDNEKKYFRIPKK